jgi:Bifunctional DNA primase/polymerase, N-terminal/AAA domain
MTTAAPLTRLEAALLYAALDWPVVPLHTPKQLEDGTYICDCPKGAECGKSAGKHPRTLNGLKDATTDEDKIRRWWTIWPHANIAIDLVRAGLVDVAPDSIEWWAEFKARGLPLTLRFASGAGEGHEHFLYVRPPDCRAYRLTESGQYDILSAGYAVMPPSLHVLERTYTWLEPDVGFPIAPPREPAPRWVVDMLRPRQDVTTGRLDDVIDDDAPPVLLKGEALERWHGRLYVPRPDGSVDRSYSLWALAVVLLEAGLQPRYVEECLRDRDEVLGWTKFTNRRNATERYRIIVERARASQGPKRLHLNGAASARPSPPTTALQLVTFRHLAETEDEDVTWIAHGILGESLITELDGKAKRSGKTTLLLCLVRAIVYGEPFFGQPTAYSRIVYMTEQSGPSFKRNLRRAGLLDRDDCYVLTWSRAAGWTWEQVIEEVLRKVDEVDAHVLIIDTLAQWSGIRGDEENKSGAALRVMEPLQAATTRQLAILISRHDRKAGGGVGDSARGSSAYAGAVDIVLHLDRPEPKPGNERQRVLEGISRLEETPTSLLIELGEGEPTSYAVVGTVEDVKTRDMRIDMLAATPVGGEGDARWRDEVFGDVEGRLIDKYRVAKELIREGMVRVVKKKVEGRQRAAEHYYQPVWDDGDDD